VVSPRKLLAAISVLLIVWLILSLILPPLFAPVTRQDPYDEVPDVGSGVTVGTGDDPLITDFNFTEFQFDFNWTLDPFMTYAIVSPSVNPRYWRQTAYDEYTSTKWKQSNTTRVTLNEVPYGSELTYTIVQNITHGLGGSLQLLSLWPNAKIIQNSIICDDFSVSNPYDLYVDEYGSVILDARFVDNGTCSIQYEVTFDDLDWTSIRPIAQPASNTPAAILAQYQSQGISVLSPTTRADIQLRLSNILSGVEDNAFEQAYAILEYFKVTFTFDPFIPQPGTGDEPVEYFLANGGGIGFNFATAYTMFLRMAGIAARPVFGGILGEQHGSERIIRIMHMHFWVEVYVPTSDTEGYWLQYDPTPLPSWITGGDKDPYVISTYYDLSIDVSTPIVDRWVPFQITATLLRDGAPEPGQTIFFYDENENWLLGSDDTNIQGNATITFTYNDSAVIGSHKLRVAFQAKSEYGGIGLHGAANLSLTATPLEINRTFTIHFNGTLIDAINGRGITYNETLGQRVSILLNGGIATDALTSSQGKYSTNYRIPSSQSPLGNTSVNATFVMLGIIDPTASNITFLNITALSKISIQATPNAVRNDSVVTLSGQLRYDNNTGIPNRTVQLFWNGTPIGSNITDGGGFYFFNYTPTVPGYVSVRVEFHGGGNIYGSIAVTTVIVHVEGTIVVFVEDSDGDQIVQRGTSVVFTGWVEDQNGVRQGGVPVRVYFNSTLIAQGTTLLVDGTFNISYQVGVSRPVGYFEVTGDVVSATLQVVSTVDYLTVNSTTQILNLQFNATQAMIGESIIITGRLVDDQSVGVPISEVNISLIYQTTMIPVGTVFTQSDGTFQILWALPVGILQDIDIVSFEANYSGSVYYSSCWDSQTLDIFSNATLEIQVNNVPHPTNESMWILLVNGTFMDNFYRPLLDREILLSFDNNTLGSLMTDGQGRVSFTLQLSRPSILSNYTVQLRHETVIIIFSSQEIVTVEAAPLIQEPITIPPELIIVVIAIAIIIVVVVILYRRRKRQPRITGTPSIDAAAMLTSLRQLLSDKKYRESIIYAFRMFEAIAQSRLGVFRDPSITLREFANLAVARGHLDTRNMAVFIRGVEEARFSDHPVSYNTALATLNAFANIYNHLTGGNLRFVTQEQEQSQ
jgi:transglutaminase-like putative cysteine protease